MRSHRRARASRYHPSPTILHCASRVSNTCSKQSARGSFMHRGKIKRLSLSLSLSLGRPSFPSPLQARALQLTINLLLNLYQECPHVVRLKETSRASLVFSPFSRLPWPSLSIRSRPLRPHLAEKIVRNFAIYHRYRTFPRFSRLHVSPVVDGQATVTGETTLRNYVYMVG